MPTLRSRFSLLGVLALFATLALFTAPSQAMQTMQTAPAAPPVTLSAEAEALLQSALGGDMQEELPLSFRAYSFPSFSGGTLVMFGFEPGRDGVMFGADPNAAAAEGAMAVEPAEVARLELFGALLQNGTETSRVGTEFTVASTAGGPDSVGVHSFGDTLQAGSYELVWGVRDTVSGVATTRRDTVEVPDYMSAGLTTSGVMVVTGQPMPAPGEFQPNTVYQGVRVLTAAFPVDLDHQVSRASTPTLTFIVAGAQADMATQQFNLELSYRILTAEGESILRVPPQPLARTTVGQPMPLAQVEGLEPGKDYVFEIGVKDLQAGTEATTEVPFTVSG